MGFNILFVCLGNTCRSPMAEALLRQKLGQIPESKDFSVKSAGFHPGGYPASCRAIEVMAGFGIDLKHHVSQKLSHELVDWADLILTMESNYKDEITNQFPESGARLLTLGEYVGENENIADPHGCDINKYQETADLLNRWLVIATAKLTSE